MSDDRTERQRQAEAALDTAIRECRAADQEAFNNDPGLVSEWVVLGLEVGSDNDGDGWSRRFIKLPEGGDLMPISHVTGLVHCSLIDIDQNTRH